MNILKILRTRHAPTVASLVAFFFFILPGAGQERDRGFLWRVDSPRTTIYLLGSIHLARRDMYPLPEAVEKAYRASDVLVLETDINKLTPAMARSMSGQTTYFPPDRIQNHLSAGALEKLNRVLTDLEIPIESVQAYRPSALAAMLLNTKLMHLGYEPAYGIDRHFLLQAKGQKTILGLETPLFQTRLLRELSDAAPNDESHLLSQLEDVRSTETRMSSIVSAWKKGDLSAMESIIFTPDQNEYQTRMMERLFFSRNRNMSQKISHLLDGRKICFVVVGSGHLVGNQSIPTLLRTMGYPVKQL